MNGITVTMPMHEYERMKRRIDNLEKESINNFVEKKFHNMELDSSFDIQIKTSEIEEFIRKPKVYIQ